MRFTMQHLKECGLAKLLQRRLLVQQVENRTKRSNEGTQLILTDHMLRNED
jgi:hypothetical protein